MEIWLKSCSSTMQVAKKFCLSNHSFLIGSRQQTQGKGSKGRNWVSSAGNLHITVGIPHSLVNIENYLIPFLSGLAIANCFYEGIGIKYPDLKLKWPNDILIRNKKVAGILIENHKNHILIGIGVNLSTAPEIMDGGRKSTSLLNEGINYTHRNLFNREILKNIFDNIHNSQKSKKILDDWKKYFCWEESVFLRDSLENPLLPQEINSIGQLIVKDNDGNKKVLTSDYLF